MTVTVRKYNPGFLSEDELVSMFCVRTAEFESLTEALHECSGSSNSHQLVIGPRGSGKTSLLLRVGAEIARDADLANRFFRVVFAEESYSVSTAGEFWLECVSRLAEQMSGREGGMDLDRTLEELHAVRDDRMLEDRCLGILLDFADHQQKRLVLIVENLNMLFRDIADNRAGWRLRKVLQTEPRIILLASATSRFDQIDNPKEALYELLRVIHLKPLNSEDCATLWNTISGQSRSPETIQALRILTGGSPRLLAIVAQFGMNLSFRDLMSDLLDLVDDHTEYFKSHLDALPAQERKVYLALAELWKPATAREIAAMARLETSKCSAQIARLVDRGAVEVSGGSPRRKLYYLTERLYNIYYLMRRSRGPDPLVKALIRFMEAYYSADELKMVSAQFARNLAFFDGSEAPTHLKDLKDLEEKLLAIAEFSVAGVCRAHPDAFNFSEAAQLLTICWSHMEKEQNFNSFLKLEKVKQYFLNSPAPNYEEAMHTSLYAVGILRENVGCPKDVLVVCDEEWDHLGNNRSTDISMPFIDVLAKWVELLGKMGRPEEVLLSLTEIVERYTVEKKFEVLEFIAWAHRNLGIFLEQLDRHGEALAVMQWVVDCFGTRDESKWDSLISDVLLHKCVTLRHLNRTEQLIATGDQAVLQFGQSTKSGVLDALARILFFKGLALWAASRLDEAMAVWDDIEQRFGNRKEPEIARYAVWALINKSTSLEQMKRKEEAIDVLDDVLNRCLGGNISDCQYQVSTAVLRRTYFLGSLRRSDEAMRMCNQVLKRFRSSGDPSNLIIVATTLLSKGALFVATDRFEEAYSAWDEIVRSFESSDEQKLCVVVHLALCSAALKELINGQASAAEASVDRAMQKAGDEMLDTRLWGHLIRAQARSDLGKNEACAEDVEEVLSILSELDDLAEGVPLALASVANNIGPKKMCDLISSSPVNDLLLPLRTALELEMGMEPRVPREVEEIAADIRHKVLGQQKNTGREQLAQLFWSISHVALQWTMHSEQSECNCLLDQLHLNAS